METSRHKAFPQDKEYELSLLLKPDPERTELRKYLETYIKRALGKFDMPKETYSQLYRDLDLDIFIAATRYLSGPAPESDYKFSTYFSWYVMERINSTPGLKRKSKKGGKRILPPHN